MQGLSYIISTEFGVPVSYLEVSGLQVDFLTQKVSVFLSGYVTEQAKVNGAKPLTTLKIDLTQDQSKTVSGSIPVDLVYDLLRNSPPFNSVKAGPSED